MSLYIHVNEPGKKKKRMAVHSHLGNIRPQVYKTQVNTEGKTRRPFSNTEIYAMLNIEVTCVDRKVSSFPISFPSI